MSTRSFGAEPEDSESASRLHCGRVAALAVEIGSMAGYPAATLTMLEQAARFHHSLEMTRHTTTLGRLAWNVVCATERNPRAADGPEQLQAVAGIVRLCNLVDERIEGLEFEHQELNAILDEIQEFAPLEGFDPSLVEHFRQMRCRRIPPQMTSGEGLPVEARAAGRVFRALAADRDYEIHELAAVAALDPVLAANTIRVANSSLYSPASRLSRLDQAIRYIGSVETRKVLLAAVLRPMFASAGLTHLWSHSVNAAQFGATLARENLARKSGGTAAEEGMILGLVHDIGAIAIQFAPRETRERYSRLVERGCPTSYVELLLFGRDHGEIGADLLAQWNFEGGVIEAVRFHHQPERSESALAAFLYLVEMWSGLNEGLPSFRRIDDCLSRTGLTFERLAQNGSRGGPLEGLRLLA